MDQLAVLELGRDAIFVVLKMAAPIMGTGLAIGLFIALFQALTSIQEMTLVFVPKIFGIFMAILIFLPFMMTTIIEFGNRIFDRMIALG